jgi:FKBP-type peptidyl-prolyl cis-trans isomerase FkpA
MKTVYYSLIMIASLAMAASCNNVSYQKTKSGLLYKIFSSDSKDSLAKPGNWLKVQYVNKINDSVLASSYGKIPGYAQVMPVENASYDIPEIFPLIKKGDSAIVVLLVDSLLKKNPGGLPPFMKKGGRLTLSLKVLDVFRNDSLYQADRQAEMVKDQPRQMKEQEEQMVKMKKEMKEQREKEEAEMEKSGEAAKGVKAMEEYLAQKNIPAKKTGKGTFVFIKEQGTGPAAALGKYVNVKYTGKLLRTDSTFESNVYQLQLGEDPVIAGWTEGLQLFKQGGKGTLYIPGFLAYGANPRQGSGFMPFEALIFDVEILNVTDTMPTQQAQPMPQRRN